MASNRPVNPGTAFDGVLGLFSATDTAASLFDELQRLRAINDGLAQQRLDLRASATAVSNGGSGVSAGSVLGSIGNFLGGGLGLSPLVSGLVDLFRGGDSSSPPPALVPYLKPAPIRLDAGVAEAGGNSPAAIDFAQGRSPRSIAAPAQITVQVQAMDSRSFLDHSQDIARAVRQAMLETTVLNDVIREV